jgi:hypothetical protein
MALTLYESIPTGDIDPESPITTSLMTALRDNPKALSEYLFFDTSDTFTVPITGYYYLWTVGGGQGGDGGGDGGGTGWTTCTIVNRQVTKDGTYDTHTGGVGGDTSFKRGSDILLLTPGGGSTSEIETEHGTGSDLAFSSYGQGSGGCNQKANPGAGGDGGGTPFGTGGTGALAVDPAASGTGRGSGGAGGFVQDGSAVASRGHGGMSGQWADAVIAFTAAESITVTIGAGGTGVGNYTAGEGDGGDGADGWAFLKLWPESANL